MKLIDVRRDDGSRHFADLPGKATWQALRDHVLLLPDVQIRTFVVHWTTRGWIDFSFHGYLISVSRSNGLFQLFVCDPQCPDLYLYEVASHCEKLLGSAADSGRIFAKPA